MSRAILLVTAGMALSGLILWQRVSWCQADSPAGRCTISIDARGVDLTAVPRP